MREHLDGDRLRRFGRGFLASCVGAGQASSEPAPVVWVAYALLEIDQLAVEDLQATVQALKLCVDEGDEILAAADHCEALTALWSYVADRADDLSTKDELILQSWFATRASELRCQGVAATFQFPRLRSPKSGRGHRARPDSQVFDSIMREVVAHARRIPSRCGAECPSFAQLPAHPRPAAVGREGAEEVPAAPPVWPSVSAEPAATLPEKVAIRRRQRILVSGVPVRTAEPAVIEVEIAPEAWRSVTEGRLQQRLRLAAGSLAAAMQVRIDQAKGGPLFAFDTCRGLGSEGVCVVTSEAMPGGDLWFIGDLHGDLVALECALWHIRRTSGKATVVFLGDLIDDDGLSHEVVVRVMELLLEAPSHYCLLPGNHDEALSFDPSRGVFAASVEPCQYSDFLNMRLADDAVFSVAQAFMKLIHHAPRALVLSDGLLCAHAGVPQRDLWSGLVDRPSFSNALCLQDFVWTRAHPRAPKRVASRIARGAEFGRIDFEEFCDVATAALGHPVRRMVRGHDHESERWFAFPSYRRNRMLTLNTLSRRLAREWTGPFGRWPCVGRWVEGRLPEVHRLKVPEAVALEVFGAPQSDR